MVGSTLLLAVLTALLVSQRSPLPSILGLGVVGVVVALTGFIFFYSYTEGALILLFASTVVV
jgi:hypothetical protein